MSILNLIERKRDGLTLSGAQWRSVAEAAARNTAPDYQLSALLMACYLRGLEPQETRDLTLAVRDSGDVLQWPDDPRPVADKHSTGGVGDKISLPLAPLLACLGMRVPMVSGRGLGITGGTLDKLESIPGFRARLEPDEMKAIVQEVGCVICGQTDRTAPADRTLYSLRDATATVPSIPLITSSIMGKKLSEGLDALVLDVKFGRAAFMPTLEAARELAQMMCEVHAPVSDYVRDCDAQEIGELVRDLGGGRQTKDDILDLAVGVSALKQVGERVSEGELLGRVHARSEAEAEAGAQRLFAAFSLGDTAPEKVALVREIVSG